MKPVVVLSAMILSLFPAMFYPANAATSKLVEVGGGQSPVWHDVKPGETLGQICARYLPRGQQKSCIDRLLSDNPAAFINHSADRLLAGKRLWLPSYYRSAIASDNQDYHLQQFSWGQIKTPK